jgi:hypothetical protein
MPQPPLDIVKYLGTPLIPVREQYPPGTGGTGPRADWAEGTLKGVEVIQNFGDKVNECTWGWTHTYHLGSGGQIKTRSSGSIGRRKKHESEDCADRSRPV